MQTATGPEGADAEKTHHLRTGGPGESGSGGIHVRFQKVSPTCSSLTQAFARPNVSVLVTS